MSRKKKKMSGFSKALIIFTVCLAVISAAALGVLWVSLSGYQQRLDAESGQKALELQAARAPQKAAQDYVSSLSAEDWTDIWFVSYPDTLASREYVSEKMQELFFSEETALYKDGDYTEEAPVYALYCADRALARIWIGGEGTGSYVSAVGLSFSANEGGSVTVPAFTGVSCEGKALDRSSAVSHTGDFGLSEYADGAENPTEYLTYTVSGQFTKPEFSFALPDGEAIFEFADGIYVRCIADADTRDYYQNKAYNFVKAFLYYCMMGQSDPWTNMVKAQNHVIYNSPAYQSISSSYDGILWNSSFPDAVYEIDTSGEVAIWGDDVMSIDVPFYTKGEKSGYTMVNEGTYRIWFLNSGSGFGIYAFELI